MKVRSASGTHIELKIFFVMILSGHLERHALKWFVLPAHEDQDRDLLSDDGGHLRTIDRCDSSPDSPDSVLMAE